MNYTCSCCKHVEYRELIGGDAYYCTAHSDYMYPGSTQCEDFEIKPRLLEPNQDKEEREKMRIKDLLRFRAFRDAVFVDYRTYEPILDYEKEIEDIYCVQTAGDVEYVGTGTKYAAIHHHLTVQLVIKEDEGTNEDKR